MTRAIDKVKHCHTMQDVRREVNALDDVLVPLLVERVGYMTQAARIKQDPAQVRGGDDAGFAMHQLLRADDVAAKRRANALVAQAHTQDGQLARKVLDRSHRDASLGR